MRLWRRVRRGAVHLVGERALQREKALEERGILGAQLLALPRAHVELERLGREFVL